MLTIVFLEISDKGKKSQRKNFNNFNKVSSKKMLRPYKRRRFLVRKKMWKTVLHLKIQMIHYKSIRNLIFFQSRSGTSIFNVKKIMNWLGKI